MNLFGEALLPLRLVLRGTYRKVHWYSQEKPALWAQILEANEADEDDVEHFVDAPAPDEAPVGVPGETAGAAWQGPDTAQQADAAAPAQDGSGGQRLLQGYDMAKRSTAALCTAKHLTMCQWPECAWACQNCRGPTPSKYAPGCICVPDPRFANERAHRGSLDPLPEACNANITLVTSVIENKAHSGIQGSASLV